MAVLFLSASMSSSVGCALFKPDCHVIRIDRPPVMNEEAIASWGDIYHMANFDFRVWMGQTILYHEKVAAELD
jgi:hypothetical protein